VRGARTFTESCLMRDDRSRSRCSSAPGSVLPDEHGAQDRGCLRGGRTSGSATAARGVALYTPVADEVNAEAWRPAPGQLDSTGGLRWLN
jgi:hypothetical protein